MSKIVLQQNLPEADITSRAREREALYQRGERWFKGAGLGGRVRAKARMIARKRLILLETGDGHDQKGCRAEQYRAGP
jgi:hypothetical protein